MSDLPTVLCTNRVPEEHLLPLRGVAQIVFGSDGDSLMPRADVLRMAGTVEAIINQAELRVDAELLDAAPKLKIVANCSIGTDNLDLPLMSSRRVWATNCPDAFTHATADCAIGMILALFRRLVEADRFVRAGVWKGFEPGRWDGRQLSGKMLGIVGYGKIGQAVARRAQAFDMTVIHFNRTPTGLPGYRDLDTLLTEADVVSLHLPLTPDTRHLIDARRLALMKPGAVLVNLARGAVVDEPALVESLLSGRLGGAALDVFEHEPQVPQPLLTMSNVLLSPHLGGGTIESRSAARLQCARNVAAVLNGGTPETPKTLPLGR